MLLKREVTRNVLYFTPSGPRIDSREMRGERVLTKNYYLDFKSHGSSRSKYTISFFIKGLSNGIFGNAYMLNGHYHPKHTIFGPIFGGRRHGDSIRENPAIVVDRMFLNMKREEIKMYEDVPNTKRYKRVHEWRSHGELVHFVMIP